jgi:hypothetical protein
MTILDIYTTYSIPENLQMHMLRVASIGSIICEDLRSKVSIDTDLVVKTLLLHDIGNIIKYDFSRSHLLSPADFARIEEIKATQREFVKKYGESVDLATEKIITEVASDKRVLQLFLESKGEYAEEIIKDDVYDRKICYYCDMRVGPFGVVSIEQRFMDLVDRYAQKGELLQQQYNRLKVYEDFCKTIEEQLQFVATISLQRINDALVNNEIEFVKKTVI